MIGPNLEWIDQVEREPALPDNQTTLGVDFAPGDARSSSSFDHCACD
jgi:hypothetical protein